MKSENLPFQLGETYEKWEFNLEVLEIERIKGYDSYLYLEDIQMFNYTAKYVELIFLLDVLKQIILIFEFDTLEQVDIFLTSANNLAKIEVLYIEVINLSIKLVHKQ